MKRLLVLGISVVVAGGMLLGVAAAQTTGGTVIIATGENFPDALGAAATGNPLLLVSKDILPSATASALDDLDPSQIYVVGGTGVISSTVENKLKKWAPVTRLSGPDRYATAAAVADAGIGGGGGGGTGPAGPAGPPGPPGDVSSLTTYVNRLALQKLVGPGTNLSTSMGCQVAGLPANCVAEVLCTSGDVALASDFIYTGTSGAGRPGTALLFVSQRNATGDGWVYNIQMNISDVIDFTLGVVCMDL